MAKKRNFKTSLVMSLFLLAIVSTAGAEIIYVDADASTGGDGQTWGTAYKYLQDALYKPATSGDQIWVAEGTYKPDEDEGGNVTPNARYIPFQLISGVALYGGFAGGESSLDERDWQTHETILSGDLIGNDGPNFANNAENSYHVVTSSGTDENAVLDGFTITAGNANSDSYPDYYGGGMYNDAGSPTVTNCTFSGNSALISGGMNNDNSNPTVTNCTFSGNSAVGSWASYGGGMSNWGSNPTVTNCTFSGNEAGKRGGGMYNFAGSPTVTDCTFSGNSAARGGGMFNRSSSPTATVTNCTFTGNSASLWYGGGMCNRYGSPTVTNCTFSDNSANSRGGGMYNDESGPTLTNCTFSGNSADEGGGMYNRDYGSGMYSYPTVITCTFLGNWADDGGGMYNYKGSPTVISCTFSGNSAVYGYGGGMFNDDNSSLTVSNCIFTYNTADYGGGMRNFMSSPTSANCTFSGNRAYYGGGGMFNGTCSPTLTNCILWGNTAPGGPEIYNENSTPIVTYSDVQGGWSGTGNIDEGPLFADVDLRLSDGSPCIDAGYNTAVPPDTTDLDGDGDTAEPIPFDLDGNPRILNDIVDMGAYESPFEPEEPELPCGLVSKWPGDGDARDSIGENHGTLNGATFAPGKVNQAFSFDGVDDCIIVSNSVSLSKDNFQNGYTMEVWINPNSISSGYHMIVDKGQALFGLRLNGERLQAYHSSSSGVPVWTSSLTFSVGTWYHIAATWDNSTDEWTIYIDGTQKYSSSKYSDLVLYGSASDGNVTIGRESWYERWYFEGLIDEVAIYNCALDADEIWYIFLAGAGESYTPLGSNVLIQLVAPGTGTQPVTVTFNQVTEAGMTSLTTSSSGPTPPPSGFEPAGEYYDVTTTASYSGPVAVCIEYDDTGMTQEQEDELTLYHFENGNGGWVPVVPCSVDTVNNTVCGSVDSFSLFAIFVDVTPPEIHSISANPNVLWPPNHKMVKVTVTVDAEDNSGQAPFCYVLGVDGVTSDEPINGPGDGNTEPDWEYTDNPLEVLLRAERAGGGNGRVYTIIVECMDASENIASGTVDVTVSHDQGKAKAKGEAKGKAKGKGKK